MKRGDAAPRELLWGAAVAATMYGGIFLSGGPARSPLYPLLYLLFAAAAGLARRPALLGAVIAAAAGELFALYQGSVSAGAALAHAGFAALFAALAHLLLAAEVHRLRRSADEERAQARRRVEEDARDFRLIGSSLGPESGSKLDAAEALKKRQLSSVRAIRASLLDVLEVARLAVKAETAMVFLLNEEGSRLKLKECVSLLGGRSIIDRPIPATEGALGAVVKTRRAVNLRPKDGGRGLGYRVHTDLGSFLGVPVLDGEHVLGVLAVDRAAKEGFGEADEELLVAVAREVERALESERVLAAMDRVKYEQERLYAAFALLNEVLTPESFAGRLLDAAARVRPLDFACVTFFDAEASRHTVARALSSRPGTADGLSGQTFPHADGGLVAMAVKNAHPMPYVPLSAQPERGRTRLFGRLEAPELASVKVFPLLDRGQALGTLILGSLDRGQELTREEERMLEVISAHAAVTLANARMYERMETMATTDGLTGLTNHRRFQELLGEALARARRFSRKVSVLMVDADHFKTVNDTYGHPVGDLVLKRIAGLLGEEARRTDVVARYGGEEFVVVLDETDTAGAELVAERLRERIEREVIQGEFGRLKVTASLGLATWPEAGDSQEALLEAADAALYQAKKRGRNRVELWRGADCAHPDPPAKRPGESKKSSPQVRN